MAFRVLGPVNVSSAGTRVKVSSSSIICNTVSFQGKPANTGNIYVGDVTVVGSTLAGTALIVSAQQQMSLSTPAIGGLDLSQIYLDADTNGEGVVVSYVEV